MEWIAKCVHVYGTTEKTESGGPVNSIRLRGLAPLLDVVVNSPTELPFHLGEEYVVTVEPLHGVLV